MRMKLTIAGSLFIGIQTILFWLYFPLKLEEYAIDRAREKAESVAAMTASALGPAVYFQDTVGMGEALQLARKNKDLAFLVVENGTGNVYLCHNPTWYDLDDIFSGSDLTRDGLVFKVRTGVTSVGRPVGRLVVGMSLQGVYANVAEMRQIITVVSLGIFLLSIAMIAVVSSFMTRPLRRIVQTVNTVSPADLTTRAEVPRQREVAHLAIAFNRMLGRIEEQTQAIRAAEEQFRALVENVPAIVYTSATDNHNATLYVSPQVERFLGYTPDDLMRDPTLWFEAVHPDDRPLIEQEVERSAKENTPIAVEYRMFTRDGRITWWHDQAVIVRLHGNGHSYAQGVMSDITSRKEVEKQLQVSLRDKDVLLKEIHHRVKNNLQVISSLLYLQARTLNDPQIKEIFLDSQNRVRSMALVHEQLYRSVNFGDIDFDYYLRALITSIARGFRRNGKPISITRDAEGIQLNINEAIPCGLLINELVTNAFKHAFPCDRGGLIHVSMTTLPGRRIQLSVADDGVGLPETIDPGTAETLGLKLVQMLSAQLGGAVEVVRSSGTMFRVVFAREG
jgi:PAS domain S-box-containing protein